MVDTFIVDIFMVDIFMVDIFMVDTSIVDTLIAACVHRVLLSAVASNTRRCPDYRCERVT